MIETLDLPSVERISLPIDYEEQFGFEVTDKNGDHLCIYSTLSIAIEKRKNLLDELNRVNGS